MESRSFSTRWSAAMKDNIRFSSKRLGGRGRPNRRHVLKALAATAPFLAPAPVHALARDKWKPLAQDVRGQMAWAWRNYVELAFGHDQIKPVSGGAEPFFFPARSAARALHRRGARYAVRDGARRRSEEGVRWIRAILNFDIDGEVQVFETSIRIVGGLLSGWCGTHEKKLLALAKDMADRLSPAFTKSPTGMPYRFVNLKTGAVRDPVSFPGRDRHLHSGMGHAGKAVGDKRYLRPRRSARRRRCSTAARRSISSPTPSTSKPANGSAAAPASARRAIPISNICGTAGSCSAIRISSAGTTCTPRPSRNIRRRRSTGACGFRRWISKPAR